MTSEEAYKIHAEQAQTVADIFDISAGELAQFAFAVNKIENRSFNPNAKNPNSSARGMMQMLTGTQKELETKYLKTAFTPNRIFDANYSVFLGQYELARQLKRYGGSWRKAVHAYNRGSYQASKSKSKSFASGELYANHVFNEYKKTDYAALNQSVGISTTTAANGTRKSGSISMLREWT